jgi:hypothetical protein
MVVPRRGGRGAGGGKGGGGDQRRENNFHFRFPLDGPAITVELYDRSRPDRFTSEKVRTVEMRRSAPDLILRVAAALRNLQLAISLGSCRAKST